MTQQTTLNHQQLTQTECLYDRIAIEQALDQLAEQLNSRYQEAFPVLLCVMNGALITMGQLLPKLTFALEVDYIHASRYGDKIVGGELNWHHKPRTNLAGRDVLLVEDIVDKGTTLEALRDYCRQQQVASVSCVTLLDKPDVIKDGQVAEFIGISIPDRYVFGFGLDYEGIGRNLPGIYALTEREVRK